ncbi:hypothetical protein AVEN_268341-1 [Araneus ventricosus]|uniref:Uncharacterized protein n=1 Tax=Araneus ventricosus TaxID=182803 RepID=A0A4Y2WMX3_ARAVE|nr:hypothetical protein AVEN_148258-1 [Araneus ventricosus]GBO38527.1 hypothetical protein AVEN_268341-1 [Araneus ventricosus]
MREDDETKIRRGRAGFCNFVSVGMCRMRLFFGDALLAQSPLPAAEVSARAGMNASPQGGQLCRRIKISADALFSIAKGISD